MSAISGSSRWVTQSVEPARKVLEKGQGSTRRLPPAPVPPPTAPERTRSQTRRLPPPPLPQRPAARTPPKPMREEESDAPNFLDFAPGTQARELARFAPEPTPSRSASVSPSPTPVESPPADLAPATGDTPRRLRRSSDWRLSTGCRVCGAPLDSLAFGCRRCGETAPRGGSDVSSGATAPLPEHPPLRRRRLALMGALACVAIGLPVTLFLEGEWRYVGIGADLLVGAMAGPFARNGLGLSAFAAAGTAGVGGKVVLGTLLGGAALSWHALQTDPLLLGLLGATLFATIILGGLLSLAAASDADEAAG